MMNFYLRREGEEDIPTPPDVYPPLPIDEPPEKPIHEPDDPGDEPTPRHPTRV
jgi:hypothetical protein